MNLKGDKAMRSSFINEICTRNSVKPCTYTVTYGLDTGMVPFLIAESIFRSLVLDSIKPSVAGLIIYTCRPSPWRRVNLELITMDSSVVITWDAGRTELYT